MKIFVLSVVALCCCSLLVGCGGTSGVTSPFAPSQGSPNAAPQLTHVVLVVEENHSYSDVIGNANMPFLNSLASKYGLATQYFADSHTSIGNYFMLTAGQIVTVNDAFTGTISDDNIVRELNTAGRTWKSYAESLPFAGYLGGDAYPYFKHHNPFTYFTDVTTNAAQAANVVPFGQFATDLAANNLPNFSFIVPNVEHDAHDCPSGGTSCADADKLIAADNWLKQNLTPLLNNSSFLSNGVLLIVFDEGNILDFANVGGHVPLLVISSRAKPAYKSTTTFMHESTLRLILQSLGAKGFPGASANAPDMGEFFH